MFKSFGVIGLEMLLPFPTRREGGSDAQPSLRSFAVTSSQAPRQSPDGRPRDARLFDLCLSQGSTPSFAISS